MTTHEEPVTTTEASATATAGYRLHVLASSQCGGGSCPTVYSTDHETVVVQGYVVNGDNAGVEVPDGEHLVEIPVEVLLAAADALRTRA